MKKLYLSYKQKKWLGVIGGFAEYFDVDATLLRVLFCFGLLATGVFPLVIAYIVAYVLMPVHPEAPLEVK